ncbi:MAG TPA: DHA2 family efflux MFS transporter permease subunit [Bryobacteraceae bacterium]|jgi:DHA2 family multidrug resistance protein|nr:DHA2 family efflux MFS transporter permease subunit [Bryobacteraceae bacterium]
MAAADTAQQQEAETARQNVPPGVNPWLIAIAVILPAFMEVIDTSIASVCLPHIAGSLSASNDEATWVLTFYLLSNAVVLPASGWFSLRFGRRRFLIASIVIFTIASFFCGAATSLLAILIARLVQGAGGGALQPLSQAILTESFPPEKRGMAMGMFGLGVVVAPILGPTLGGWLTDAYSWRWAFYINIPFGILAIILILRFVKDPPYITNANPGKLDWTGFGLLALSLGCMQVILDRGQQDDWFGAIWLRWAFGVMIVTGILFIIGQLTREKPLVDLKVFTNRNFTMGSLLIFLFGASIYGAVTLLPLFYQSMMDYSAWWAGLAVSPRGIGAIVAMPLVGMLVSRIDTRILVSLGFGGFGICSLIWGFLNLQISPWSLTIPIVLSGAAAGMVFVPLSVVALGDLPPEAIGNGSGVYNLLRNVGGSIGISVVDTILARHQQLHQNELVQHVVQGSPVYQHHLNTWTQYFSQYMSPTTAQQVAVGQVARTVGQQAMLWSYIDDLRYMGLACLLCVPIVWGLKKVRARGMPSGAH